VTRIYYSSVFSFLIAILFAAPLAKAHQKAAPTVPETSATAAGTDAGSNKPSGTSTAAAGKTYEFDVPGSSVWLDTKVDVLGGAELQFTAAGSLTYTSTDSKGQTRSQSFGPAGLPRGWRDLIHQYPVTNAGHGAMIGRIGSGDGAQLITIGESQKYTVAVPGRLFVGINQGSSDAAAARGSLHVTIQVLSEGTGTFGAPFLPDSTITGVTSDLLAKIPRRVSDPAGSPGDMVNVLLIGSQDDVTTAFKTAGWVQVDRSVTDTLLNGALSTFSKEAYLTMPMSVLYLFGRAQDYGFAHAEPVKVVESRNHLRAWKSEYEVDGQPLWCIAATHDIGFERDQRNNGLTHKIDPAIDGEREYVNDTLTGSGLVTARSHIAPPNALTTAKTATGGEFHSDGRILVLVLKHAAAASP
jgi:hypothetical protein